VDRIGRGTRRGRSRVDDDVDGGHCVLVLSKVFAHESLHAIAARGIAGGLDTDREPEACVTNVVGSRDDEEQRIGVTLATRVDDVELWLIGKALRAQEAARRRGRSSGGSRRRGQTARRLRPFARRRLNTRRPPFVAMRARKPWTRLRCRLLG
jgi:hypothetical protein